jgi:hypothetical protein
MNTSGESSSLEQVKLSKLFTIMTDKANECDPEVVNYRNFIWKLLLNQHELDFYVERVGDNDEVEPSTSQNSGGGKPYRTKTKPSSIRSLVASKMPQLKLSNIVSHNQTRGFCADYAKRKCINAFIKINSFNNNQPYHARSLAECLKEY